jgi:hypothetical protein
LAGAETLMRMVGKPDGLGGNNSGSGAHLARPGQIIGKSKQPPPDSSSSQLLAKLALFL